MSQPSRAPLTAKYLVAFFGAVVVLTIYGFAARPWLPEVASRHGKGVDTVIWYLLATTGPVFVAGHVMLAWLVWTRSSAEATEYQPVSSRTELLWAMLPIAFMGIVSEAGVLALGHPVWSELYGEPEPDAMKVEVVGKQFEWFVRYPGKDGEFGHTSPDLVHEVRNPLGLDKKDPAAKDDLFSRGVLRLPVDRMVRVRLRTHDVQHSFAIPSFRVKQDLVPGFPTQTQFVPTREGEYEIACAELCGLGHYKMRAVAIVLSEEEFKQWKASQLGWFE